MADPDDEDWYYDDYDEDPCDCEEADLDILTGIESCPRCGASRWLSGEELKHRLQQEAEWAEAYHEAMQEDQGNGRP